MILKTYKICVVVEIFAKHILSRIYGHFSDAFVETVESNICNNGYCILIRENIWKLVTEKVFSTVACLWYHGM